jgi:homoserine O-acetyltransferase
MFRTFCLTVFLLCCTNGFAGSPQHVALLGDLELASGEILHDCQIGYRIDGTLNDDRSNVIVFLTWFTGTTADLARYDLVGPGKLADTDHSYVISIDALGNGVSTSPSNSTRQSEADFPFISIEDMVNSQHELLTRHLGIQHVNAVIGLSMGGMQTFQWIGQHPDFMDRAIPIEGSPGMTSYDLVQWRTHEMAIEMMLGAEIDNGDIMRFLSSLNLLTLWTPRYFLANVSVADLQGFLAESGEGSRDQSAYNYLSQLRAMMAHDVYANDRPEGPNYANSLKADVLVVNFAGDQMVNPAPGRALAESVNEDYIEIETICGHMGTTCESDRMVNRVHEFLE